MNLQKLNPWNWFKHEEAGRDQDQAIPVSHRDSRALSDVGASSNTLFGLHREIDRLFDQMLASVGATTLSSHFPDSLLVDKNRLNVYQPQIDVSGDLDNYIIQLDVPGLSESDLSIEVKDAVLTIKGGKEERSEDTDKEFYRVERKFGSFQRTLSLPDDAKADDIKASLNNGVLSLSIPRQEQADSDIKHIAISS